MESILYNISQVLGITIIHSLWQGLLVYVLLRIVFAGSSSLTAVKKYNLAIAATVAIAGCFIYTLFIEIANYSWVTLKPSHSLPLLSYLKLSHHTSNRFSLYNSIKAYLPFICAIYFIGLLINIARLAVEWNKVRFVKSSGVSAGPLQQYVNTVAQTLNIAKNVTIKLSSLIDVPCALGYFKPLILLPVTMTTNLTTAEVEAIILHELSHIKRNDYLVNLLQQFITVLLFFNPFTQLINGIINQERENGCDDLVVEHTGEPLIYAQALIKLEEVRKINLQFAMAATGKKFHLLNRIERIMKTKKHMASVRHLIIALFLLTGTLSCIAWFNPKTAAARSLKAKMERQARLANGDSTEYSLAADTGKKHKTKLIAKNKKSVQKNAKTESGHYSFNGNTYTEEDLPDSVRQYFNSPQWKNQMALIKKQGEEMQKKFNSPEWKAQMEQIKKQGEEMSKKFNSPEWKNQMLAMQNQAKEMQKKFDSPEWKAQMEDIKKNGEEMQKKFNSPEWKAQMEDIKRNGEMMQKKFNSPEWKTQMEDIKRNGEMMQKKFNSPEWKAQMEDIKKNGEEMAKKFNSPEWKAQTELMKKQGEEMAKKFNSPEWKAQMKEMENMGKEMQKQFKNTDWGKMKNKKWKLKDTLGNSKVYTPENDTTKNDQK